MGGGLTKKGSVIIVRARAHLNRGLQLFTCSVHTRLSLWSFYHFSYTGELQDPGTVTAAVKDGLASPQFRQVIVQVCNEIKSLNKMEEGVSVPQG